MKLVDKNGNVVGLIDDDAAIAYAKAVLRARQARAEASAKEGTFARQQDLAEAPAAGAS
jgi:hypothetical protein